MAKQLAFTGLVAVALLGAAPGAASAAQTLRRQVSQRGDFILIGNTLAHDCAAGTPAPIVGTVPAAGACGTNTGDSAPDIYWRADSPLTSQAEARTGITVAQARSTAVLTLPDGARVTHAYLYWAGSRTTGAADLNAVLERSPGFSTTVTGTLSGEANTGVTHFQVVSDVTSIVQARGSGAYRVGGIDTMTLTDANQPFVFAGWWMVVFYELDGAPARNLALFDGIDFVFDGATQSSTVSGFVVPATAYNAKLGVIGYDGDSTTGDALQWQGTSLSDSLNPDGNFFNSTRSLLGAAVSNPGDLPRLTGTAQSMSGIDLDVVQIPPSLLTPGQTEATIDAVLSGTDSYLLGGLVTSVSTLLPDLSRSTKSVVDLNGGGVAPGDTLEYTIVVVNSGDDDAANVTLRDPLPAGITYVPGSIEIAAGANVGPKTDAAGDDQGEYNAATRTITMRLGAGASGTQPGTLDVGASTTVRFRVTIDATTDGLITNQATLTASSPTNDTPQQYQTDGNGDEPGAPATDVLVDSDGDGLSDGEEADAGTDLLDADSDDDGVSDFDEELWNLDSDGDGLINALDPDSDDDGLLDATEMGVTSCDGQDTDTSLGHCVPDGDGGATTTDPLDADTDNGGVRDGLEDFNLNGVLDPGELDPTAGHGADDSSSIDSDGDGLSDQLEAHLGTDPNDPDTDDDGIRDGSESNFADDTDDDGRINALDPDSDNDGLFDGTERGQGCSGAGTDVAAGSCTPDADLGATRTSMVDRDSDDGGVSDGSEDANLNGVRDTGETNPTAGHGSDDTSMVDSDADGLSDALERYLGTDPNDADTDDDGVRDGREPNPASDTDRDGLTNALDVDSDNDGLYDGTELGLGCDDEGTDAAAGHCTADADGGMTRTSPIDADTDGGGRTDGSEDANLNGALDPGEADPTDDHSLDDAQRDDSDSDGLSDALEEFLGTDPNDADTDNDGVRDGDEPNPADDGDGDGLIDVLDVDSDNDGLLDGTELGLDCSDPGTDTATGHCTPDADEGATTTSPLRRDTDGGGAIDGSEDANLNGAVDAGETDPTTGHPADDTLAMDSDGDGLSDALENFIGSDAADRDSDNDGRLDGDEPNPSDDHDGDGDANVIDVDSDGDGLFDGTEVGAGCDDPDTDATAATCTPDADSGATTTNPLDDDTDGGGVTDGVEDENHDGAVDDGETNPNDPRDDETDLDGDGLTNPQEAELGTDPRDADSDDDGLLDGQERAPGEDSDGDGTINALDVDSDDDGLFDGTELGQGCGNPDTDVAAEHCTPDADEGATTTDPTNDDTDGGGVGDGNEDANHNGRIDEGERDPNDPADDMPECVEDSDCGDSASGMVCDESTGDCVPGCRGTGGNGCPDGQECTSEDDTIGTCSPADLPGDEVVQGGGCVCAVGRAGDDRTAAAWALLLAGACAAVLRRRRRG